MKISKLLNVPFHAHGKGVIDSNATEWYFQVEFIEAAEAICHAVNNHDKLVELLEYFYKQPVDLMQVWPAGHIAKQNEAIALLKELGHEI